MEEDREYEPHVAEDAERLSALIELRNKGRQRSDRITQDRIGSALGITQGIISAMLRGKKKMSRRFILGMYQHFGIHVKDYSPTMYDDFKELAPLFASTVPEKTLPTHMQHTWKAMSKSLDDLKAASLEDVGRALKAVDAHKRVMDIYFEHESGD